MGVGLMATVDYAAKRATAERLLTKYGAAAKLVYEEVTGGGTPSNPGTVTPVAVDCVAAVVDYTEREMGDSPVLVGSRRAIVSVPATLRLAEKKDIDNGVRAFADVRLRFPAVDGIEYQIGPRAKAIAPSGYDVVYDLQVRR